LTNDGFGNVNNRERTLSVLNYQPYDRLPLVHFGYWNELLDKWAEESHITLEAARGWGDGNAIDARISAQLGFDFNWSQAFGWQTRLYPPIEKRIIEERPDGSRMVLNEDGGYVTEKTGIVSIPTEVDHILKGRREWEEFFKPRLEFDSRRICETIVTIDGVSKRFDEGGFELLLSERQQFYGLYCGGLLGVIRDWLGLVGMSYLMRDDEALFDEIVSTVAELIYQGVKDILEMGIKFDFAHFWEDIAYKNGPLINPSIFHEKIGPRYHRITELLHRYGVNLISVDCDGKIDALIPTWFENGVNVMFPIEVGTWKASFAPWRRLYGHELRGVGGVNKHVFGMERSNIDREIERICPLVDLGGYIPCPDHRLPIEAKWENVQYYCEKMRKLFG
jgi:uroporphyrinogen decarboxylase